MVTVTNNDIASYPTEAELTAPGDTPLPAYTPVDRSLTLDTSAGQEQEQEKGVSWLSAEEEKAQLAARAQQQVLSQRHPTEAASSRAELLTPASAQLQRALRIPTNKDRPTSGFSYPRVLAQHDVSLQDWSRFTSEVTDASRLQGNDWTACAAGAAGTLVVTGAFIGWFGLIAAAFAMQGMQKKREMRNFDEAMGTGMLEATIERWNKEYFVSKNLMVRVEPPAPIDRTDGVELFSPYRQGVEMLCQGSYSLAAAVSTQAEQYLPPASDSSPQAECKRSKFERKQQKWNRKIGEKQDKWERKAYESAGRRGRIVVLPANQVSVLTPVRQSKTD